MHGARLQVRGGRAVAAVFLAYNRLKRGVSREIGRRASCAARRSCAYVYR